MSHASAPVYDYQQATPTPRKKRRVFLWVFLVIQVLFLIWIIAGAASGNPLCCQPGRLVLRRSRLVPAVQVTR